MVLKRESFSKGFNVFLFSFTFSQIILNTSISLGCLKYFENGDSSMLFEQENPIFDKRATTPDNLFVMIIFVSSSFSSSEYLTTRLFDIIGFLYGRIISLLFKVSLLKTNIGNDSVNLTIIS